MNEKQKIFAAGTVVGAATGFGMASFLLMLGALYMAPQLLDTMKQEAMVLHPPSQVQSAPLLFENPSFPMESAADSPEGETQAGRVIHVRAVQGGALAAPSQKAESRFQMSRTCQFCHRSRCRRTKRLCRHLPSLLRLLKC